MASSHRVQLSGVFACASILVHHSSTLQLLKVIQVNAAEKKYIVDGAENNDKSMDSLTKENDNGESQQWETNQLIIPLVLAKSWKVDMSNEAVRNQNSEEASSLVNDESVDAKAADGSEHIKTSNNDVLAATGCQLKNFVAIVDPPHAGLHPTVSKFQSLVFLS
ncbi:hypothetical protein ZWY2020_029241 [Hordeum vulgare]|nr:hypothetical protein ZWY2020_029241 [Hordeum vulgare]